MPNKKPRPVRYNDTAQERLYGQSIRGLANTSYTEVQKRAFLAKHSLTIAKIINVLPKKSMQHTSILGAVLLKCSYKYGLDKALEFGQRLKAMNFKGQDDPVYLLWARLFKGKPMTRDIFYSISVTACRAFCEGRSLTALKIAKKDIFEWNKNWEYDG